MVKQMAKEVVFRRKTLDPASSVHRRSTPSRKRLCVPSGPSSSQENLDLPNSIFDCHACGAHAKGRLQTLASHWRVVLLCPNCFSRVESSEICSYCFSKDTISASSGVDCRRCNRRVHRSCLSCLPAPDSFTCVDCWVPKSLEKSASSVGASNFLLRRAIKDGHRCWRLFGDVVGRDMRCNLEKTSTTAIRVKQSAVREVASAKQFASGEDGCLSVTPEEGIDDKEMAIRLHRLMNSSPRISKVFTITDSFSKAPLKKQHFTVSDFSKHAISWKPEVRENDDKLFGNPDIKEAETSPHLCSLDQGSFVGLGALRRGIEVDKSLSPFEDNCMADCAGRAKLGALKREREKGAAENFKGEWGKLELPIKEEQGSCSNKVLNSSEEGISVESESGSCRKHSELKDMNYFKCSETVRLVGDDGSSSSMLKNRSDVPDRQLITYIKRKNRPYK